MLLSYQHLLRLYIREPGMRAPLFVALVSAVCLARAGQTHTFADACPGTMASFMLGLAVDAGRPCPRPGRRILSIDSDSRERPMPQREADVAATPDIERLVAPGQHVREVGGGVLSALSADRQTAPYDRHAGKYDRLIGSRLYNRLIWGTRPEDYSAFADEALRAGEGPFLEVGCGTAVFTAAAYRETSRPLVLTDRSLEMLGRAAERLGDAPATLMQADIHALPFSPGSFQTVACFAVLHVLDDPWSALAALREHMAPDGTLFASMLVTDRGGTSRPYLSLLRRRGEVGPLRSASDLKAAAISVFGDSVAVQRTGSMAWLRAGSSTSP